MGSDFVAVIEVTKRGRPPPKRVIRQGCQVAWNQFIQRDWQSAAMRQSMSFHCQHQHPQLQIPDMFGLRLDKSFSPVLNEKSVNVISWWKKPCAFPVIR
jgi:hypothetical protein